MGWINETPCSKYGYAVQRTMPSCMLDSAPGRFELFDECQLRMISFQRSMSNQIDEA